jgi:hypothetical protein
MNEHSMYQAPSAPCNHALVDWKLTARIAIMHRHAVGRVNRKLGVVDIFWRYGFWRLNALMLVSSPNVSI